MSVSMEPGATELTRMPTGGASGHQHYFVSIGVLHLNK